VITIYPFQTQEVRDLAWACFSPPLIHMGQLANQDSGITDCTFELTPPRQVWLEALDRDASTLLAQLAQRPSHRLGIYFEQLWQFFLRQDPEVQLVASNLPVHDQGSTLGEFDCIYFCQRRQRHVHLELAVKYFLGWVDTGPGEGSSEGRNWLGPDTRDRLDKKIDHILHRQILLSDNPVARQRLSELGIERPLKEIALKGQLFQPREAALKPPRGYNSNHAFREWLHCDRLAAYLASTGSTTFEILPKMRWLSNAQSGGTSRTFTRDQLLSELTQYFVHDDYPLLIAALDRRGQESSRFFVTDRDWPHRDASGLTENS
jgi:hypothetical protein